MGSKKEFTLHNGKGVLYGRYSTDEFARKFKELSDRLTEAEKTIINILNESDKDYGMSEPAKFQVRRIRTICNEYLEEINENIN